MSATRLANLQFTTTGNTYIYSNSNNIYVTTANANVVFSQTLFSSQGVVSNNYYIAGNTQYYMNPAGTSYTKSLSVRDAYLNNVKSLTTGGYGGYGLTVNGKLYTAQGDSVVDYSNARGGDVVSNKGLDNLKEVVFPNETTNPIKVGLNYTGSYALFANGNLYTWGTNNNGPCGLGHTSFVKIPALAATGVVDAYTTPSMMCFSIDNQRLFIKKSDGFIYGAGYNGYGALGLADGSSAASVSSFTIIPGMGANPMSVWNLGSSYGCTFVQKADGTIWSCGYNGYGQLGNGGSAGANPTWTNVTAAWTGSATNSSRYIVRKVGGSFGYYSPGSSSGAQGWVGMLLDNGNTTKLMMCGYNGYGQLGNGGSAGTNVTPNEVVFSGRIADVTLNGAHAGNSYALLESGVLYAWGYNGYGELGVGDASQRNSPVQIATNVDQIFCHGFDWYALGWYRDFFYRKGNALYGTGYNGYGQLGIGDTTQRNSVVQVLLPSDFKCVDIGMFQTSQPGITHVFISEDDRIFVAGYGAQRAVSEHQNINIPTPVQINLPFGG